jgi:hypothetical protein
MSQSAKKYVELQGGISPSRGKLRAPRESRVCPVCLETFVRRKLDPRKFCSSTCFAKVSGGVRAGSGRAIPGWYKGIYCGSTYELAWVIYNLDHAVPFIRFPGEIRTATVCYVPDFLIGNRIIEIKGYAGDPMRLELKRQAAVAAGYEHVTLFKKDLKECFEWVKEHYDKPLHLLYDNSSKYKTSVCESCQCSFEHTVTEERKYCSRKCAGNSIAKIGRTHLAEKKSRHLTTHGT